MPASPRTLAFNLVAQSKELLRIFGDRDWESFTKAEKIAAGLLGRWVIERLLRAYAYATDRVVPVACDLPELHKMSGCSLVPAVVEMLGDIEQEVCSPEPEKFDWGFFYERTFIAAESVREAVLQNLVLCSPVADKKQEGDSL